MSIAIQMDIAQPLPLYINCLVLTSSSKISDKTMRAIFAILTTLLLFLQANASALFRLNTEDDFLDTVDTQMLVKGSDGGSLKDLAARYREVKLPSGNVLLGPPKFPGSIIAGIEQAYCTASLSAFNATCANACGCMLVVTS
jgi:hypothetical protein